MGSGKKKVGTQTFTFRIGDVFDDDVTLKEIADVLNLNIDQVWSSILDCEGKFQSNHAALTHLYEKQVGGKATNLVVQRSALIDKSLKWAKDPSKERKEDMRKAFWERTKRIDGHPSNDWTLSKDLTLKLPGLRKFKPVLLAVLGVPEHARLKPPSGKIDPDSQARWGFEIDGDPFGGDDLWDRIRAMTKRLAKRCETLQRSLWNATQIIAKNQTQVHLLHQCYAILECMSKNTTHAPGILTVDKQKMADAQEKIAELRKATARTILLAEKHLLEPNDLYITSKGSASFTPKNAAQKVLNALRWDDTKTKEDLGKDVQLAVENFEFAPVEAWQELRDVVSWAARLLLLSPLSDKVYKEEISPTLRAWERLDEPLPGETRTMAKSSEFTKALAAKSNSIFASAYKKSDSVFKSLFDDVNKVKSVKDTGLKLKTPALNVCGFMQYAHGNVVDAGLKNPAKGFSSSYRFLCATCDDLTDTQRNNILFLVENPHFDPPDDGPKGVGWKTKSSFTHLGLSGMSLLSVFFAFRDYDSTKPLKSVSSIVGGLAGAGDALADAVGTFARILDDAPQVATKLKLFKVTASRIACVAGIIEGSIATYEAVKDRDDAGAILAGLGTAGAVLSFAGTLMTMGAATAFVGGVGAFLLIAGAILSLGALVVGFLRKKFTKGTKLVFDLYSKKFPGDKRKLSDGSLVDPIPLLIPELKKVYEDELRELFGQLSGGITWWELDMAHPTHGRKALKARGFSKKEREALAFQDLDRSPRWRQGDPVWVFKPHRGKGSTRTKFEVTQRIARDGRWVYTVAKSMLDWKEVEEDDIDYRFQKGERVWGFLDGTWRTGKVTKEVFHSDGVHNVVVDWDSQHHLDAKQLPVQMILPVTESEDRLKTGTRVWGYLRALPSEPWRTAIVKGLSHPDSPPPEVELDWESSTHTDGKVPIDQIVILRPKGSK